MAASMFDRYRSRITATAAGAVRHPVLLLVLFVFINVLNYVDRGVVPGGFASVQAFIAADPLVKARSPDIMFGLLQSMFVVGYSVASIVLGHVAGRVRPGPMVAFGLGIWVTAVIGSGLAPDYYTLIAARCLSGVGEAAFQLVVPPWIEDHAPASRRGLQLSLLFGAIPVGTALGYALGGASANSWKITFFVEGLIVAPLVPLLYCLPLDAKQAPASAGAMASDDSSVPQDGVVTGSGASEAGSAFTVDSAPIPTLASQLRATLCDPVYFSTVMGYAGMTGVLSGLGSFGPQFLQGLGFVRCQASASLMFGAAISVAGLVGTPLGGWALDRHIARDLPRERARDSGTRGESSGGAATLGGDGSTSDEERLIESGGAQAPWAAFPGAMDDSTWLTEAPAGRLLKLRLSLWHSALQVVAGSALVACAVPFAGFGVGPFMACITLGATAFFAATAPVNLAIMAVPAPDLRPFAIGLSTLLVHACGDTPAPTIIGALTDAWAPQDCPGGGGGGPGPDPGCPVPCPRPRSGLLATLGAVISWLGWPCVLWALAYWMANRRRKG